MGNRIYEVEFTDEKAIYHQKGDKKIPKRKPKEGSKSKRKGGETFVLPKRQLLPNKGKDFSPAVMNGILDVARLSVENTASRINKTKNLGIKDFIEHMKKDMDKRLPPIIKFQILRVIKLGESPAKNQGKYKAPYSESYQKSKLFKHHGKSANEVNLKLTGDFHKSLKVTKK